MTLPLLFSALLASLAHTPALQPVRVAMAAESTFGVAQDTPDPPACAADVQWLNDTQMNVSRTAAQPLTLFASVGRGSDCSAFVAFSAAFFDGAGALVCSGTVDARMPHGAPISYVNLEVRPGNIYEFMRWVNGPRATAQQWSRIACMSPDGQTEVQPAEFERAQSLRLHAVVLPSNSGLATADIRMILRP